VALITDPDLLEDSAADDGSQEVYINTATKTIKLVTVGNLSTDGVTLKCLYSFLKEEWRLDPNTKNLAAFPFPMTPITDEQFELVDGWDFVADASRYLIRTGGWAVRNVAGNVTQMWAGVVGLGDIEAGDQLYFQQSAGGAATNFQLTGQVNQAVQILRDDDGDGNFAEGSDFDRRSYLKIFVREQAQVYDDSDNTSIGRPVLTFQSYGFPISTAVDLNIDESDVNIAANAPYTDIRIRYFDQAFTRDVESGTGRSFGIVIDVGTHSGVDGSAPGGASVLTTAEAGMGVNAYAGGTLRIHEGTNENVTYPIVSNTANTITVTGTLAVGANMSFTAQRATPVVATLQQIYEKIQHSLRQNSDIDATDQTVTGKTADLLAEFVGSTLKLGTFLPTNPNGGGSGVIVEGFRVSDTNDLVFTDNGGVERSFPFVASLTLNFGANLVADASAKYWVFFTTLPGGGNDYGETGAVIVDDNNGVDMAGNVSAQSSVTLSFNYDGNSQGGRTPGTDAPITVVALGLATGQYVRSTGTIGRSTSNSVSLTASLERNYQNP
jgi:hypothetical protein